MLQGLNFRRPHESFVIVGLNMSEAFDIVSRGRLFHLIKCFTPPSYLKSRITSLLVRQMQSPIYGSLHQSTQQHELATELESSILHQGRRACKYVERGVPLRRPRDTGDETDQCNDYGL